ncbi:hypothetical protein HOLleu_23867 [Holothuria leucospilota]|uniref:Uncharacterized protein n=1 Tax=Holothuria leucospilota TaxID=206669 RepID=A0A9Q1BW09_HOLLE|nr:hypothetical protein HOLleu_23867 [Holothuria leucospilota]
MVSGVQFAMMSKAWMMPSLSARSLDILGLKLTLPTLILMEARVPFGWKTLNALVTRSLQMTARKIE